MPKKGRSTRFEDDEDDYVLDDDDEAHDQLEKMRSLEADRKPQPHGKAVSSYTRGGLSSASTRIVDLTSDQVSYGMRPSTAIQLD